MKIEIKVPYKIFSEANVKEHWAIKNRRKKAIFNYLNHFLKLPPMKSAKITFIRISPRSLDYDNLLYAFKNVRDYIADRIIPGKKMGQADSSKNLSFFYEQQRGDAKEFAFIIVIEPTSS